MCQPDPSFSTLVGPRGALRQLIDRWERLDSPARFRVAPPHPIDLAPLSSRLGSDHAPEVALVNHHPSHYPPSLGPAFVRALQAELVDVSQPLVCERGYMLRLAAAPTGGGTVQVHWARVDRAIDSVQGAPTLGPDAGVAVAILDSGDSAGGDMVDLTGDAPSRVAADDLHGHGTAISQLVRHVQPKADLHPVRIFAERESPSYVALSGLIYCLHSGLFDVINASITTSTVGSCPSTMGRSIAWVASARTADQSLPVMMAAAGNRPASELGYPALLAGATVVRALNWAGRPANYNVDIPPNYEVASAIGGTRLRPLGGFRAATGPSPMFGTSYATALVTGAALL